MTTTRQNSRLSRASQEACYGRRRRVLAVVSVAAAIALSAGCAARGSSFSGRFVKPGEPAVSFDTQVTAPLQESLADYARRLRTLQANARPKSTLMPTIESQDPQLSAALLRLSMWPSAENHRQVAEAYRSAGVKDYAHRHFQRAVQLEPCDSAALEGLARLWRDWGAAELALGDAHRAVFCRPHSASAHNTLGTVFIALGQRKHARQAFQTALWLDNRAAFALNNLCYVALQEGNGPEAQQACERTLALEPAMVAAQTNLALAYALQGDISKAEGRLLDSPDPATGQYNVGILRMSLGRYNDAAQAFDLALMAKPSLPDAARRAAQARGMAAAEREQ